MESQLEKVVIEPGLNSTFYRLLTDTLGEDCRSKVFIETLQFLDTNSCSLRLGVAKEYQSQMEQVVRDILSHCLPDLEEVDLDIVDMDDVRYCQIKRTLQHLARRYPQHENYLRVLEPRWDHGMVTLLLPNGAVLHYIERCKLEQTITQALRMQGMDIELSLTVQDVPLVTKSREKDSEPTKEREEKPAFSVLMGRKLPEPSISIADLLQEKTGGIVEGRVFSQETRQLKKGGILQIFDLTDDYSSVTIKAFNPRETVKEGSWYKIKGQIKDDTYAREKVLMAEDIMEVPPICREDTEKEKRFEFHLHTKMSDMDGLIDGDELAETLQRWGHGGAAITDHGVVQSFPSVYAAFKKRGLKFVPGMEANVLMENAMIYRGSKEGSIDDFPLVFLDLETTGLCPWQHEVMELGAVRVEKGDITEYQTLIRPVVSPEQEVLDLTGIRAQELEEAPPLEEIWQGFLDFIDDALIIAHNSAFDIRFLSYVAGKHNLPFSLPHGSIDTLNLSRAINPQLKAHGLGPLTRAFKINLTDHHRALADANATRVLWNHFRDIMEQKDLRTLAQIRALDVPFRRTFPHHSTLLARNTKGLHNLYRLVTESHLQHFYRRPCIPLSSIEKSREGLLIGSGCVEGLIYEMLLMGEEESAILEQMQKFDYIEILPPPLLLESTSLTDQKVAEEVTCALVALAKKADRLPVAVSNAHFLHPQDRVFRDILTHVGNPNLKSNNSFLPTTAEMKAMFACLGEEEAQTLVVDNSQRLQETLENVQPIPDGLFPPAVPRAKEDITKRTWDRARELYGDDLPPIVKKRIEKELQSIIGQGYATIYAISQILVKKSLDLGYLVGSRGSVGSSLVAFLCDITEVNPLPPHYRCPQCCYTEFLAEGPHDCGIDLPEKDCPHCSTALLEDGFTIPFEVFLGFEGDKVPDIDLNFAGEIQQQIHAYTEEIFGTENVFRAGTISTIAERTAYGFIKGYLEDKDQEVNRAEMKRLMVGCSGVRRTTGQHPGGLMVVPEDMDIHAFTPIQYPANDTTTGVHTTHFDYRSISSRLLKLDLLGHDDPSNIRMLQELTGQEIQKIPMLDSSTMSIFSSCEALGLEEKDFPHTVGTLGIPEFGTPFVRGMLEETKPQTFSELLRISGLSHGTDVWLNNAQELIAQGEASLNEVISTREDIMNNLIQWNIPPEQAFTIMEKVRKGKGLQDHEERLMKEKGVPLWYIQSCKKIKYMFPKAHAAAYVLMSYRVAYFKVHYPIAFYATYFTSKASEFDAHLVLQGLTGVRREKKALLDKGLQTTSKEKSTLVVLEVLEEAFLRGMDFLPVDLLASQERRFSIEKGKLRPPLLCIQGLGANCARRIVEARAEKDFSSVEDFLERTQTNKTVLEALRAHGSLQGLPEKNQLSLF